MKYFIAYKQTEDTYAYVTNIGTVVNTTLSYALALNFLSKKNAQNVCSFLKEYDNSRDYVVLEYEYSISEV